MSEGVQDYVEVIAGGSGSQWTRHSLLRTSLTRIREVVDKLLREHKIPTTLERGLVCEKDPITGERDPMKMLIGVAGPFTIYWRRATQQELDEFSYDTWLVFEFSKIEV